MLDELFTRSSIATTCLVGLTVGLIAYWAQRRLRYRLPPGPFALPLLGNMFQLDSKIVHRQSYEWSKRFGPVLSLYVGPMHIVLVNDIETALEVLVRKSTDFASRIRTPTRGYDIPKDTMVLINHWALHNDPGAWEDADAFKPERFLDDKGKMGQKPRNWLPFSAGKKSVFRGVCC